MVTGAMEVKVIEFDELRRDGLTQVTTELRDPPQEVLDRLKECLQAEVATLGRNCNYGAGFTSCEESEVYSASTTAIYPKASMSVRGENSKSVLPVQLAINLRTSIRVETGG